jgi:hypothetical protein
VQDLADGGERIRGARGVAHDARLGAELEIVDSHHHERVDLVPGRDREDDARGSLREVLLEERARAVLPRGLDDDVHIELRPVHVARGLRVQDPDLAALGVQVLPLDPDGLLEAPVHRVELEEVLQALGVRDVHDRDNFDVVARVGDPEHVPADAAEPHDPDPDGAAALSIRAHRSAHSSHGQAARSRS